MFIRAAGLIYWGYADTMIAGSLVDENRFRYDLGSMGGLPRRGKNEAVLDETAAVWGVDAKSETKIRRAVSMLKEMQNLH